MEFIEKHNNLNLKTLHNLGREPVSIIYCTRTGSSIKLPNNNKEAALGPENWGVVYPGIGHKIILPPGISSLICSVLGTLLCIEMDDELLKF